MSVQKLNILRGSTPNAKFLKDFELLCSLSLDVLKEIFLHQMNDLDPIVDIDEEFFSKFNLNKNKAFAVEGLIQIITRGLQQEITKEKLNEDFTTLSLSQDVVDKLNAFLDYILQSPKSKNALKRDHIASAFSTVLPRVSNVEFNINKRVITDGEENFLDYYPVIQLKFYFLDDDDGNNRSFSFQATPKSLNSLINDLTDIYRLSIKYDQKESE